MTSNDPSERRPTVPGSFARAALFSLRRPTPARLDAVVGSQLSSPFTYDEVGATRGTLPDGWTWDEQRRVIGTGSGTFGRAVTALRGWVQFRLDWVWPLRTDVPIEVGEHFAFLARSFGVWTTNVCRVVYVIDEPDARPARFGFAYGTVGAHAVRGEEQFLLTWDRDTDEVAFSIRKFSRPASWVLRAVGPVTRAVQARFTRDALDRLAREVAE